MDNNFEQELKELRYENEQLKNTVSNKTLKDKKRKEKTKKTLAWTWKLFTGKSLHKNFNDWFSEFHSDKKVSADTSANLLTSLVQRFVRVRMLSVILLLFSLIPSLVSLYILVKQNDLIKTQNSLAEASRQSSYGFQLANIFDAVDKQGGVDSNLRARIIGLSHSLRPYKILEGDELSERAYSPERTQLLLFLVNNTQINNTDLSKIFDASNFSNCDLRNTNLIGKYLVGINLENSNLEGAELHSSNLSEANLKNAILENVKFSNGKAIKTIFIDTNLKNAKITKTNLTFANFSGADTENANFDLSELKDVSGL